MKKLALIGAVSALALVGGQAFALDELEVSVDKNVVPVVTGDGSTAVGVSNALNGNKLFSDNTANIWAPRYEDESTNLSVAVGDVQVNATLLSQTAPGPVLATGFVPDLYPTASAQGEREHGGSDPSVSFTYAPSYKTGDIAGSAISGTGIINQNQNTGSANQFSAIYLNAKVR